MNDEAEVGVSAGMVSTGLHRAHMRSTHHTDLTLHSRTDSHSACKSNWRAGQLGPRGTLNRSQATHNSEQLHVVEPHAWSTGTEGTMGEVNWLGERPDVHWQ